MKIMVVGGGGREHAIIKKLAKRKLQNYLRQSIESLAEYLAVSVQSETPQSQAKPTIWGKEP